jgi:hypothetical protein
MPTEPVISGLPGIILVALFAIAIFWGMSGKGGGMR